MVTAGVCTATEQYCMHLTTYFRCIDPPWHRRPLHPCTAKACRLGWLRPLHPGTAALRLTLFTPSIQMLAVDRVTDCWPPGEAQPGFRPGGRPTFLRAQESRQRKRPCSVAPSLREGVPCDARSPRPAQNSLRSLRSLRSNSCAESVHEASFARASGSCASRLLQRGTRDSQTRQPFATTCSSGRP